MSNSKFTGYLAVPSGGTGPGMLVLHPWWGLNDTIKHVCDQLAREGYIACAPDLYHGQIAVTIEEAEALSSALDERQADADISEALSLLTDHASAGIQGFGVIGFSLGAYFALKLSNDDPDHVRAVVLFYGTGPEDYSRSRAAYLGHFAENDPYESVDYVKALEAALQSAGRPVTFHSYAETGHWFAEPDRPDAYNESAARLAWERTLSFLETTLNKD